MSIPLSSGDNNQPARRRGRPRIKPAISSDSDETRKIGKPGRRPGIRKLMHDRNGGSRNNADMIVAAVKGIADPWRTELMEMVDRHETSMTVVACVAKFPPDQQREAFALFQKRGARWAKRYCDGMSNPPTPLAIKLRLLKWCAQEFPTVPGETMVEALRWAAESIEAADPPLPRSVRKRAGRRPGNKRPPAASWSFV